MNAAFMAFQPHESGIHALWPGAGEVSVTEVHYRCAPRAVARRERITILKLTENTLWMVPSWLMPYFTPAIRTHCQSRKPMNVTLCWIDPLESDIHRIRGSLGRGQRGHPRACDAVTVHRGRRPA